MQRTVARRTVHTRPGSWRATATLDMLWLRPTSWPVTPPQLSNLLGAEHGEAVKRRF
jgi:hypothetical protein